MEYRHCTCCIKHAINYLNKSLACFNLIVNLFCCFILYPKSNLLKDVIIIIFIIFKGNIKVDSLQLKAEIQLYLEATFISYVLFLSSFFYYAAMVGSTDTLQYLYDVGIIIIDIGIRLFEMNKFYEKILPLCWR